MNLMTENQKRKLISIETVNKILENENSEFPYNDTDLDSKYQEENESNPSDQELLILTVQNSLILPSTAS